MNNNYTKYYWESVENQNTNCGKDFGEQEKEIAFLFVN